MSELVLDVSRLVRRRLAGRIATGVDRVSLEYVRHFRDQAIAVLSARGRAIALSKAASGHLFDELVRPSALDVSRLVRILSAAMRGVRRRPSREALLLNTGHSGLEHSGYSGWVAKSSLNPVYFVHDLIPLTHPEYCRPGEADRHRRRMLTVLRSGRGVVVNSECTLTELDKFARDHRLQVPPHVIAHLGPAALTERDRGPVPPLPAPYFVMLGTIEPRKNHALILTLWRRLVDRFGSACPKLVIIGRRGWESEGVFDLLDRSETLKPHVVELPRCTDAELAAWLSQARAVLFPSFTEGYGMPLIEALSLGVPVIASNLPVFREIAGDVPDYVDPIDGLGWMGKIMEYTELASGTRSAQLVRIGRFVAPDWKDHFRAVESLIDRISGR